MNRLDAMAEAEDVARAVFGPTVTVNHLLGPND